MFLPASEPVQLSEAGLAAFCSSLNAPVVSAEGLPPGPARCAIAVHAGDDGGWRLSVAVRSLGAGVWLIYGFQGDLSDHDPAQSMDIGLTFAEAMGFLFDEDWLGAGQADAPGRALVLWSQLLAAASEPGPAPAPLDGLDGLDPLDLALSEDELDAELLLDEVAPEKAEPPPAMEEVTATQPVMTASERRSRPPRRLSDDRPPTLSKFRKPEAPELEETVDPGQTGSGSQLGRISLVRRRVGSGEAGGRMSALMRLLTGY